MAVHRLLIGEYLDHQTLTGSIGNLLIAFSIDTSQNVNDVLSVAFLNGFPTESPKKQLRTFIQ